MTHICQLSVVVQAQWDDEAGVWIATSEDVPGLVVEHENFRELQNLVHELIPELLIENDALPDMPHYEVPVSIMANTLSKSRVLVNA